MGTVNRSSMAAPVTSASPAWMGARYSSGSRTTKGYSAEPIAQHSGPAFSRELHRNPTRATLVTGFDYSSVLDPKKNPSPRISSSNYSSTDSSSTLLGSNRRMQMMSDMAALSELNPSRAKSHLQTSGAAGDMRLAMLKEMNLSATERLQLKGDVIGSDRLRTETQSAGKVCESTWREGVYKQAIKDISSSGLKPHQKSNYLSRIKCSDSNKSALTLHSYGDYKESNYATARVASTGFGRTDLRGAISSLSHQSGLAPSSATHLQSAQIL